MSKKVYLTAAARTPICPMGGALRNHTVPELAAETLQETVRRSGLSMEKFEDVILSNALAGGGNIARLCALQAGFDDALLGSTIDRQCVGGLDAIIQAKNRIQKGNEKLLLAGGVESFSLRPDRLYTRAWKEKKTAKERPQFYPQDVPELPIGRAVSVLKKEFGVSDQDEYQWAALSHRKSIAHQQELQSEMILLDGVQKKDPFARKLNWSTYQKSQGAYGDFHPCNTAPKADAAAFLAVGDEACVAVNKSFEGLEIMDGFTIAGNPERFPILPAVALKQLLEQNDLDWSNIAQLELMEAYATQAILCAKLSGAPIDIINPWGGTLSSGHPIGASGAALVTRLFYSLKKQGDLGVAAIAGAGGLASVMLVKKVTSL